MTRRTTGPVLVTIWWRDIPSQVNAQDGRQRGQWVLEARFERAIERAARRAGIDNAHDFTRQWRRTTSPLDTGVADLEEVARSRAMALEAEYDEARLRALIRTGGVDPPPFADVTALSFDCYGTLIDWESGLLAAFAPWRERVALDLDDDALLAEFARHESALQREQPGLLYPSVLATSLERLAESLDRPATPHEAAAFGASVPDWPAFADSAEALAALGTRYRLVIVSNVDRASFAASNARLGVNFDHVITAEDVGAYKPALPHFDALFAALPSLGIERAGLLHVAQSLFHDHEPAAALDLPSVWIDRRRGRSGGATADTGAPITPRWRYESMHAFARAALA